MTFIGIKQVPHAPDPIIRINEVQTQARSSIADLRSQLEARQLKNNNLTSLNSSLAVRIDNTKSALASIEVRLLALTALHTAEQRQ